MKKTLIEPIEIKAGDERVLVNGHPFTVDFRVISEENYKELKKAFDLSNDNSLLSDLDYWKQRCELAEKCMKTKNKIITIRENLIREIEERNVFLSQIADATEINYIRLLDYCEGDESILNGAEIQRIFDYLNGLK